MSAPDAKPDSAPPVPQAGEVLTLDDVRKADFTGVTPLGVLGFPIKHSVSPQMHNAALKVLAETDPKFKTWRYYRIEVPPEKLKEALDLLAEKGFLGLNLTIPHKVLALEWVNVRNEMGTVAGAVNTLVRKGDVWSGFNTDGVGFAYVVSQAPLRAPLPRNYVVILGAGGAARAIAAVSVVVGCRGIFIGNRSKDRLDELLGQLQSVNEKVRPPDGRISIHGFDLNDAANQELPADSLIVNATSLGLKPDDPSPIDLSIFSVNAKVFDTTYGKHRSNLLLQADALGMKSSGGLPMLVEQGHEALFIWIREYGKVAPNEDIRALLAMSAAAYDAIGMPPVHNLLNNTI